MARPETIPARSDDVLLTETKYDSSTGQAFCTVDPAGKEHRSFFDALGRTVKTIANYIGSGTISAAAPDENVTVEMTYHPSGQIATLTAKNSATGDQTTRYIYGTAKAWQTPQIYRNDLLAAEIYPDSDNFENSAGVLQTGTSGVVDRIEFLYNRLSERIATRDQNGTVHSFEYDNLGRLLHDKVLTFAPNIDTLVQKISTGYNVTGSTSSITSYAANDNVINQVKYEYGNNQKLARLYQSHGGAVNIFANEADVCTHDRDGNMTLMPGLKGKYDAWNRLVEVRDSANSLIARYDYNGVNQRIKKTVGSVVTQSFFSENWQELESVVNNQTTTYVWGLRYIDDLIYRQRGAEKLYSLADANWNVVAITDSVGAVQDRLKYDAFGKVSGLTSDWNRTFTGQVLDSDTGLMLYRNRYYHSGLGRFIQRDPIGYESEDVSLYRYVSNMPVGSLDTYGLDTLDDAANAVKCALSNGFDLVAGGVNEFAFGVIDAFGYQPYHNNAYYAGATAVAVATLPKTVVKKEHCFR